MAPSLRDHPAFVRPSTRDRPATRGEADHSLIIPSRTSSLHSRITQPVLSTHNVKPTQKSPKTLTLAYMVCGVGREPSQWVKAPSPSQGKIGHMKGAAGQFWLPEILGSSPRLEQDNEIARTLYAAMRVRSSCKINDSRIAHIARLASPTMSKSLQIALNRTAYITPLCFSKTRPIPYTELHYVCGPVPMINAPKPFATYVGGPRLIITTTQRRCTGYHIV